MYTYIYTTCCTGDHIFIISTLYVYRYDYFLFRNSTYFGGAGQQASQLGEMIIDSLSPPPLGFTVALRSREGLGVHDLLRRHLPQLCLEPKRRRAGLNRRSNGVRQDSEVVVVRRESVVVVGELQGRVCSPVEEAGVWGRRGRRDQKRVVVVSDRVRTEVGRVEGVDRREIPWLQDWGNMMMI